MQIPLKNIIPHNNGDKRIERPLNISDAFIAKILTPYKKNARYLRSASICDYYEPEFAGPAAKKQKELVTIEGKFSMPESCYIDYTGHFNSVEFNLCYNQLAYVLFGKCIQTEIFQRLVYNWEKRVDLRFETFLKYQLSSMYIVKIEASFLKPLNNKNFQAILSINRIMWTSETVFVHTQISFADLQGVKSKGNILVAFKTISSL